MKSYFHVNKRKLRALVGLGILLVMPAASWGALSEAAGTGVWEVQSAESQRPARLELGIFTSYQRLGLRDSADTQINGLRGGVNGVFGIPGGFELSGTLPLYGYYNTNGSGGSPFDKNITVRIGDVTSRLRWTTRLFPGLRWGLEGEAMFATGNDEVVVYPGRGPTMPYTANENSYTGRALMTWDGLRAGTGVPLRLHANAAYTFQEDETRFLSPHASLPLELGIPARNRDNDFATLAAAAEFDLPRFTMFGEVVTHQFVNERTLIKGKENQVALTPGVRFWMPGGISIAGGYTFNLSDDDAGTAFDPGRAFPGSEWRAAISLGTVYRGKQARIEDAAVLPDVSAPAATAGPIVAPPAGVVTASPVAADTATSKKDAEVRAILERRPVQEETATVPEKKEEPQAELQAPMPKSTPAAGAKMGAALPPSLRDTDGDGITDDRDQCPLAAEDWDGFADLDGCPDLDNDQDGIPDVRDQCPNDPETFNGYYDFDGCPDELPGRVPDASSGAVPGASGSTPKSVSTDSMKTLSSSTPAQGGTTSLRPEASTPGLTAPASHLRESAMNDSLRAALEAERARRSALETTLTAREQAALSSRDTLRTALDIERQQRAALEANWATRLAASARASDTLRAQLDIERQQRVALEESLKERMAASQRSGDTLRNALEIERQMRAEVEARLKERAAANERMRDTLRTELAAARDRSTQLEARLQQQSATTGRTDDTLRAALETARRRAADLESRLGRAEGERQQLMTSLVEASRQSAEAQGTTVPVPAITPSSTLQQALDAERDRNAQLEARLRELERQQLLASQLNRRSTTPPATVITPPRDRNEDVAVRLAMIEAEMKRLQESSVAAPASTSAPAARNDAASEQILARLAAMQKSLDSLRALEARSARPAPPITTEPVPAQLETARNRLDAVLALGTARSFSEVQFESGRAQLAPGALATLDGIGAAIKAVPTARVQVVGHTDNVGRASANLKLSRDRALAVAEYLFAQGVGRDQLSVSGRGEEAPIADNATADGRNANRRVEFVRTR